MRTIIQNALLFFVMITSLSAIGQCINKENIRGKWNIEKIVVIREVPDPAKVQNEFMNFKLNFGQDSLIITKVVNGIEQLHKSGPYHLSADGQALFIGNDRGDLVTFNDQEMEIKVKDHYIMHLTRSQ